MEIPDLFDPNFSSTPDLFDPDFSSIPDLFDPDFSPIPDLQRSMSNILSRSPT
jgi:hypothetical protein